MTIYTTAAKVAKHDVCDGGTERTAAALAKRGLTMNDVVPMQLILEDLGLCDALFSFCEVEKKSRKEADLVIREYMRNVAGYITRFLSLTHGYGEELRQGNHVLNKRFDGIDRPSLLRKSFVTFRKLHEAEVDPAGKHWLNAYSILLSPKPDHICAVHSTVALLEGAAVTGFDKEMRDMLVNVLQTLLDK